MKEDKTSTAEEVTFTQHEDCPYDAVQVDVFDFRNGGETVKKSEFFTQAEAPQKVSPGAPEGDGPSE